jgi:hypothetical protein
MGFQPMRVSNDFHGQDGHATSFEIIYRTEPGFLVPGLSHSSNLRRRPLDPTARRNRPELPRLHPKKEAETIAF